MTIDEIKDHNIAEKLRTTETHWMGTLVIRSTSILNLNFKASSWMITFHTKDINYLLINCMRNTEKDIRSPK